MINTNDLISFFDFFKNSFYEDKFIKLTLSKKKNNASDLNNVFLKPVLIKNQKLISFVYRHQFNDVTKNFDIDNALIVLEELLKDNFLIANLITSEKNIELKINKKGDAKIFITKSATTQIPELKHDYAKKRKLDLSKKYFFHLGITTADGILIKSLSDKYKQIEKYIEIVDNVINQIKFDDIIKITDMGSGKGYLTFALYDYLSEILKVKTQITGVETQKKLVDFCNKISTEENFENLHFKQGNIDDCKLGEIDLLIALHACDTATDDAIYKGIKANAKAIIVAPCCHKQIRKQIKTNNLLNNITKHGILLERQSEIITDGLRALILEANGYKTNVFEFISSDHTGKNIMITAIKSTFSEKKNIFAEIEKIKNYFGIEYHYLEKLLLEENGDWKNQNPICEK